jgi:hypothetical protein
MSAKDSGFNLDLLVEDAEERAKAAKQLRDIANRFPDLLKQVCMYSSGTADAPETNGSANTPLRKRRMPPTEAVRRFLQNCPEGATRKDIVAGVMGKMKSKAGRPADVINASITVLKRKLEIEAEAKDGGLTIYKLAHKNGATS